MIRDILTVYLWLFEHEVYNAALLFLKDRRFGNLLEQCTQTLTKGNKTIILTKKGLLIVLDNWKSMSLQQLECLRRDETSVR